MIADVKYLTARSMFFHLRAGIMLFLYCLALLVRQSDLFLFSGQSEGVQMSATYSGSGVPITCFAGSEPGLTVKCSVTVPLINSVAWYRNSEPLALCSYTMNKCVKSYNFSDTRYAFTSDVNQSKFYLTIASVNAKYDLVSFKCEHGASDYKELTVRECAGVHRCNIHASVSPITPVLGSNGFVLRCDINVSSPEILQEIVLKRKKSTDPVFEKIVSFPAPTLNLNYTLYDQTLAERTDIEQPDASTTTHALVTFTNTSCRDFAEYKWSVTYYINETLTVERLSEVKLHAHGSFTGTSDFGVTTSTGYDVQEGTNVTFTCKAHVGAGPSGQLLWYMYYMHFGSMANDISSDAVKGQLMPYLTCSYTQESTLQLSMSQVLNGIVVECKLMQSGVTINDDNRQTDAFNVSYSVRQTAISAVPSYSEYSEGEPQVHLICNAVGNPTPTYSWLLPSGSEACGRTYTLQNLKINDTGNYTCMAKNGVPNDSYSDSATHVLIVVEKTTTTTTTTTTTPTTPAGTQKPTTLP